jgi:hypothetical protein
MYRLNPQYNIKPIKKQAKTFLLNTAELELVRSPRFEPGSSAWQADVLDQTRLRPPCTSLGYCGDAKLVWSLFAFPTENAVIIR